MATSALGYQSFYQAQLTSNIDDTELIIPLDTAPIPNEGFLVIESTVAAKREIIYYTSKTSNSVTCPAGAGLGRGYDGTTAVSHLSGSAVIMAPVAAMFESLTDLFTTTPQGWTTQAPAITTVVANGNRSYTLTHASSIASTVSPGMRRRFTRTTAGPNTAFSLDGSNDYYSKSSPTGLSFTTTFTCSSWVYLTSYQAGGIISRRNADTEGWSFAVNASGQVQLAGLRVAANNKAILSYQALPLNKWVHVAATMDMAVADTSAQKIWIDGVEVPRTYTLTGTATALVQGTTALCVGSLKSAGSDYFPGYIDQAAVFSSQLSDATIKSMQTKPLTGAESTLVSAYGNGSTTDLASTGNNLTAQNGATTVASAPWGNRGVSTTLEYGLTMSVSSDGLTEVVQCPEGCALPDGSSTITASAYSSMANPYGWVSDKGRWEVNTVCRAEQTIAIGATAQWFISNLKLTIPAGSYQVWYQGQFGQTSTVNGARSLYLCLENSPTNGVWNYPSSSRVYTLAATAAVVAFVNRVLPPVSLTTATTYSLYGGIDVASGVETWLIYGTQNEARITALPSGL